jgi:hypothetical protein
MKREKVPLIEVKFTPKDSKKQFLIQVPAHILFGIRILDRDEWAGIGVCRI